MIADVGYHYASKFSIWIEGQKFRNNEFTITGASKGNNHNMQRNESHNLVLKIL